MTRLDTNAIGRRRFLKYLLGFSVVSTIGMVATPVIRFLIPPPTSAGVGAGKMKVGTTADIPVGSAKVVPIGGRPTIVINGDQGVRAFSAICTHLGCIVAWDQAAQQIVCPCHDGRFNPQNGTVVSGPPPSPLPSVTATIEGEDIFVVAS
ncbi:MAG: Rieske 2Fe-2S domain-containing protein [Mycobacterium sp.]